MKKKEIRTGRKLGWILLILMILWVITFKKVVAQAPLGVNYQGIARNMDGTPKSEKAISIRVSILEGGISGIIEYSEIHEVLTNQFGLFTLVIGQGDHVGSIQDVDWASGNKWLQIELDADGGSNFDVIGAQQIFSVPYAMYATQSGSGLEAGEGISIEDGVVTNTAKDRSVTVLGAGSVTVSGSYPDYIVSGTDNVNDADSDPSNEIQTFSMDGDNLTLSNGGGTISIADGDSDSANELQTLNQTGSSVSLSNGGGTITVNDPDADPTNEIQTLTRVGENVTLSNGGGSISVADGDADSGNEIQTLNQVGSSVTLSNGGGSISIDDADSDPANEFQTLTQVGYNVTLSNGGGAISIADGDADSGNEIQTLNQTGSSVTLSNGGGSITVDDPDADPGNEIQTLTRVGEDITLSNGGGTVSVTDGDADPGNEMITGGSYIDNNTIRIIDGGGNTDIPVGTLNSNLNADANRIINLADPIDPQDAVKKGYLDQKDATDYAFKIPLDVTSAITGDFTFTFTLFDFDEGNLISGSQIIIAENGIYSLTIKGTSTLINPADLYISINTIDSIILIVSPGVYQDTFLFKLNTSDIIELKAIGATSGEVFNLEFFGFKL